MKQEKKSPITLKPLRYAGQSLDEKIDQLLNDKMLPYIISGMFLILMTGMEWLRYYTTSPPTPKTTTFIAACYFAYAFYKIKKMSTRIMCSVFTIVKCGRFKIKIKDKHLIFRKVYIWCNSFICFSCKFFWIFYAYKHIKKIVSEPKLLIIINKNSWNRNIS